MTNFTLGELAHTSNGRRASVHTIVAMTSLLMVMVVALPNTALAAQPGFSSKLLEHVAKHYGPDARTRILSWEQLILDMRGRPLREKLVRTNRFFNQIGFVEDRDHWGMADYWATPVELVATRGGDCEDYAIAKYFTLKEMGVPDSKMRVIYVRSQSLGRSHMVLGYYPSKNSDPLILDSFVDKIHRASKRSDLKPLYSFNSGGIYVTDGGSGRRIGDASRISAWLDVRMRLAKETGLPRDRRLLATRHNDAARPATLATLAPGLAQLSSN